MEQVLSKKYFALCTRLQACSSIGVLYSFLGTIYLSIPITVAQFHVNEWNCRDYCRIGYCGYFSETNECKVCGCSNRHPTSLNGTSIGIIVVCIFVFTVLVGICVHLCKLMTYKISSSSRPRHSVVAAPVSGEVGAISGSRRSSNMQMPSGGYINPVCPQKSNDYPPEYLAPPPYNECVIEVDTPPTQLRS